MRPYGCGAGHCDASAALCCDARVRCRRRPRHGRRAAGVRRSTRPRMRDHVRVPMAAARSSVARRSACRVWSRLRARSAAARDRLGAESRRCDHADVIIESLIGRCVGATPGTRRQCSLPELSPRAVPTALLCQPSSPPDALRQPSPTLAAHHRFDDAGRCVAVSGCGRGQRARRREQRTPSQQRVHPRSAGASVTVPTVTPFASVIAASRSSSRTTRSTTRSYAGLRPCPWR